MRSKQSQHRGYTKVPLHQYRQTETLERIVSNHEESNTLSDDDEEQNVLFATT